MKSKIVIAAAALALSGGSVAAFAHGDHSHTGPQAQQDATPGAQANRHGENMPMQMADMHDRMNSMHGTAPAQGSGKHGGSRHMHEKSQGQTPAPATPPAK